jgi:plastocyanin
LLSGTAEFDIAQDVAGSAHEEERPEHLGCAITAIATLLLTSCGGSTLPESPTPPFQDPPTASAYILPGAVGLSANAFGDDPIVIYKGERLRWVNADTEQHDVVTDTPSFPEFNATGLLPAGGERAFVMNTTGTTKIHCRIHPQMVGTLIVQER